MSLKPVFENVPSDARHYFEDAHCSPMEFLRGTTALYDPVFTPLFTSMFLSFGFSTGVATTLGSIASAIAMTAISVGINAAMAEKPPKPEDGKTPMMQAIPPRIWGVGRRRISGAYMLWEAKGNALCSVQAIAGHRIKGINRYYLHDDQVTIDGSGYVQGLADGRYSNNRIRIDHRLGANPETAYSMIVDILGAAGIWTNNHRGDGQASLGMICRNVKAAAQGARFPFGHPRLSVEADLAYVWDPRDPAQDPDDESTWQFSRNAALIMLWHQCFNPFGHRRDYRKAILPVLDMWIEEADVCDEDIPLASGGTQKRYWCGGFDTTDHHPKVATNAILAACDGWICERGDGALLFTVGKFRESRVATLTDADISGYQLQHDILPEDEINRLIPQFCYPATDYSTSDTDYFEDSARQAAVGRPLAQPADYTWCDQWQQARRLGKREWLRIQEKKRGSIDVRLSGINAVYARWIRLQTPKGLPGLDGKLIENRRSVLAILKGGFQMEFIKHPDNIETWTPETDEGAQPPVPSAPNAANLDTPVINSVIALANSGSVYLRVKVVEPTNDDLTLSVRYRLQNDGSGSPGDWVEKTYSEVSPVGGYLTVSTGIVPNDQWIEVEAAFISAKGKYSEWSTTETVFSTSNPTAPPAVTITSINTGVPGEVTINIKAPNSSVYAGAKFYTNTTNDPATASYHSPVEAGVANGTYDRSITLVAGSYYGWVSSVNSSGVEQAIADWAATGSFTIT